MWKLSANVTWGSLFDVPEAIKMGCFKSVLSVGGNYLDLSPDLWPAQFPEEVLTIRLARPDNMAVTEEYFAALVQAIIVIRDRQRTPVFVHCRAGQMRSPAVACLAAYMLDGMAWPEAIATAKTLRPDIMYNAITGNIMAYCQSLLALTSCPPELFPAKRS